MVIFDHQLYHIKMNRKLRLVLLLICFACISIDKATASASSDTIQKKQFPCIFELPNNEWNLVIDNPPKQYLFKRSPATDSTGRQIIPAIMLYSEDATSYKGDIAIFCSKKIQPFLDRGVKVPRILSWNVKDYPLTFKNALFAKGEYTSAGLDHIIYMIYIIDKHNKGIQVYLDMTKNIAPKYEPEFWKTIKSLKEMP